jgi:hypothetical protein
LTIEFNHSLRVGNPYCDVIAVLNHSQCPYLIIGGVAVVLHGSSRFTPDINLLLDFKSENFKYALAGLKWLGLTSSENIQLEELLSEENRKNLVNANKPLFKLDSKEFPSFSADLLLAGDLDFSSLHANRQELPVFGHPTTIVSLDDLINMKQNLNRPQDQMDVMQLMIVRAINQCGDAKKALESLAGKIPDDYDRSFVENLNSFRSLTPTQKFEWLLEMLAAVGGFCLV